MPSRILCAMCYSNGMFFNVRRRVVLPYCDNYCFVCMSAINIYRYIVYIYRCMLLVHRCVVRMCLFFLGIACVFCRANLCSQCVCLHFDFYM